MDSIKKFVKAVRKWSKDHNRLYDIHRPREPQTFDEYMAEKRMSGDTIVTTTSEEIELKTV